MQGFLVHAGYGALILFSVRELRREGREGRHAQMRDPVG